MMKINLKQIAPLNPERLESFYSRQEKVYQRLQDLKPIIAGLDESAVQGRVLAAQLQASGFSWLKR